MDYFFSQRHQVPLKGGTKLGHRTTEVNGTKEMILRLQQQILRLLFNSCSLDPNRPTIFIFLAELI